MSRDNGPIYTFQVVDDCPIDSPLYRRWCQLAVEPHQHPGWLLAWWQHMARSRDELQLVLLTGGDGEVLGIAPLYSRGGAVRLLGDGEVCTDHSELVVGQVDESLVQATARWLAEQCHAGRWSRLDFDYVDADGPTAHAIAALDEVAAGHCFIEPAVASCYIELPDSWDAYLKMLSKNHRKHCRRGKKRYVDNGHVDVLSTSTGWHPEVAFEVFVALHTERRDNVDRSLFHNQCFEAFLRQAFLALVAIERAEIRALRLDGQYLAAEFLLLGPTTAYAYQSGLSHAGVEIYAGSLSQVVMIEDLICRGFHRLDLMRGTEEYKYHWACQERPAVRCQWRPATVPGLLAHSTAALWSYSKGLLRSWTAT
ncbi:MAG: hypothetical protein KatS3mg111_0040 [Pirellulaceae bacterium]|nr:MAG: hypothetical protein KatS3mg111_0040 [Pirellulaceae bacterium]